MRRFHRAVMLAVLLGLAPVLAGCENFDPDKLDVLGLNKKKSLPGDRKSLFPEGVPGVTQGIPPEYLQGNVQQQTGAAVDIAQTPPGESGAAPGAVAEPNAKTATVEPAPEPKPKAKPKPKKRVVKRAPAAAPAAPSQSQNVQAQQQPAPWPTQAQAQPAAQQAQSPWPAPAQNSVAPWPSAPPPGTFSK